MLDLVLNQSGYVEKSYNLMYEIMGASTPCTYSLDARSYSALTGRTADTDFLNALPVSGL